LVVLTAGQGLQYVQYTYGGIGCPGAPTSASATSYVDMVPCVVSKFLPGSTSYECVNNTLYTNGYDSEDCTGAQKLGYPLMAAGDGSCGQFNVQRTYCDNSTLIIPSDWTTYESISYSDTGCATEFSTSTIGLAPQPPTTPVPATPVNPCVRVSDDQSYIYISCDVSSITRDYYANPDCSGSPTPNTTSSCMDSFVNKNQYSLQACANPVTPTTPTPVEPPTTPPVDPPTSGNPVAPPTSGNPVAPPTSGNPVAPPTSGNPVAPPTSPPTAGTPTTPTPSGSFGSKLAFSFVLVVIAIFGLMF